MTNLTLINATDLTAWANKLSASSTLPKLLRRLIVTTVKERIISISFRADEGTSLGGWDGRLEVKEGNAYVPDGKSVWEMGKDRDIKGKADEDYEKRKANSLTYDPSETTYVFVTPRRWSKKEDWIIKRKTEGFWKDIKVYDADDLETWLELAPSVHIWLSILLGKHPEGAIDITTWWNDWTGATNPVLSSGLIIASRTEQVEYIHKWLNEAPSTLALQADSREEALAFFAASIKSLPEKESEQQHSKVVVVESESAWRHLVSSETPLTLVPTFENRENVANVIRQGHHVFIPLGKGDSTSNAISLPRVRRENIRQELLKISISTEKAESLATLARRSFLTLRRKLAIAPEVQLPRWATPDEAIKLLPILLTGQWMDSNPADREVLAKLASISYEEINATLSRLANNSDSPVRKIGDIWFLVSREDAWGLLAKFLTRQDLDRFEQIVLELLEVLNPSLGLSGVELSIAQWQGKVIPQSHHLRNGLVETLTIMAARSTSTDWLDSKTGQDRANVIIWKLLEKAKNNWELWSSFAPHLQLIAEAAPEIFLDAVEGSLNEENSAVLKLFSESDDVFLGGSSLHTYLLWALETLAWHPDYVSRVALVLARLTRLDPGGRLANRPNNSLRDIFLGWLPQTKATLDQRISAIDRIRNAEPEVAWDLMLALLPEVRGVGHYTAQPQWREWNTELEHSVLNSELWQLFEEILRRMLEDVGVDGSKWANLLDALSRLSENQRQTVVENLVNKDIAQFTPVHRLVIWETLRRIISRNKEFSDAEWAMPSDFLDRIESVYETFTPENLSDKYSWLFRYLVDLPNLPKKSVDNWMLREETVNSARIEALKELYSVNGLSAITEIAEIVEEPGLMGLVLGKSDLVNEDEGYLIEKNLAVPNVKLVQFALGFVNGRFQIRGFDWAKKILFENHKKWSPEQSANFLSALPFDENTWNLMELLSNPDIEASYWNRVNPNYSINSNYRKVVSKLLEYERPHYALVYLSHLSYQKDTDISAELALEILEQLVEVTAEKNIKWGNVVHDVVRVLGIVQRAENLDKTKIATLEWILLPLLEHNGEGPKTLYDALANEPDFFLEIFKNCFDHSKEIDSGNFEDTKHKQERSFSLLHMWRGCPGAREDGSLDKQHLMNWIDTVRAKLSNSDLSKLLDQQIGQTLAESPIGSDGIFPHEFAREIIEEMANKEIERGFEVRVFNNRGVTTRLPTDGGGQERALVQKYLSQANQIRDKFPRTANIFRNIAANYERQARQEDVSAELTEDFW